MRFDGFMQEKGIAAFPVDRFTGCVVEVGAPPGWELFDSTVGLHVWICRSDPRMDEFCANAVLTMHRAPGGTPRR